MALQAVLKGDAFDELPEAVQAHYTKNEDGSYVIAIEGKTPREKDLGDKVNTFRENNIGLQTKVTELTSELATTKSRFDGIDPDEVAELREQVDGFKKKGVKKPDDLAQTIKAAVDAAIAPINEKLATAEQATAAANAKLADEQFGSLVTEASTSNGVRPEAVADVRARAKAAGFKLVDGQLVIPDANGVPKSSAENPGEAMGIGEWLLSQKAGEGSHLFKTSGGAGADDARPGAPEVRGGVLKTADPMTFGKHLTDIASGKVRVEATVTE